MSRRLPMVCILACIPALAPAAEGIIWVEGEQAIKRQLVDNPGLNDVRGKYRPEEQPPEPIRAFQPGQTWDFQPDPDKFDPAALLDLRPLNEKVAGEHGFIRLCADGNSFVRGDGQPIRLWAAGERTAPDQSLEVLNRQAQFLAKRGVNALRIFAMIPPKAENAQFTDVDEQLAGKATVVLPANTVYLVLQ
ncbi:MAG: hypothetical protein NTY19_48270 [Planctomycetota bacterium]|nr:hypothetical protein [Planctomycetota bacterium]